MSKQNIKRFPSLKSNTFLQRKQNRDQTKGIESELKTSTSQESELVRKIQNKLKMRKKSVNTANHISHTETKTDFISGDTTSIDSTKNLKEAENYKISCFREDVNIRDLIGKTWDSNSQLIERTLCPILNRGVLKEMIMEQSEIIMCQLSKGQKIETILAQRGQKLIKTQIMKKKIQEKQKSLLSLIDGRISNLEKIGSC